jgi:thioredoxin reductase
MSDTIEKIKCLIIGSGPAGYILGYMAKIMNQFYTKECNLEVTYNN